MLTYDPEPFVQVVREELEARGITHVELAERLGRDENTVGQQLRGRRRVRKATIDRYAHALGIAPAVFFGRMRACGCTRSSE